MKLKIAFILCLLAVPAMGQPASAGTPDAALAKKLCEDSRKNFPEDRALCAPAEAAVARRTQLYDLPMIPTMEKGAPVYLQIGTRVMAWEAGPHQLSPGERPYYRWIEWQGKVKIVRRRDILPIPFKVEQALVTDPKAALYIGGTGTVPRLPGAGTIISFARNAEPATGGFQTELILIENGDPVGEISQYSVKIGVSSIAPPVRRYAARSTVGVKRAAEQFPVIRTVPYGTALDVYTGPREILHSGLFPAVEAGTVTGYVWASEISENAPTVADFMTEIRKQLEAADFTLAAGISRAAGEKYPGNADFEAIKKGLDNASSSSAPAPLSIPLGKFVNLLKAAKGSGAYPAIDAALLRKNFQEQYASGQFETAVATSCLLDRLQKNGMQPLRTDVALFYACRGDIGREKDVTISVGSAVPAGNDWCAAKVDLDGPCDPCREPVIGADDADEMKAHNRNYVVPKQKQVDRYRAWKAKFQQAVPASPKVRLHFENLSDAALAPQTAFLYHYSYSYPEMNYGDVEVESGVRNGMHVRVVTIPGLEPGASVNLWVEAPAYNHSAYGLVFAQDEHAAAVMVAASPLPKPAVQVGPSFREVTVKPRPGSTGVAIPTEVSTPFRLCNCWRQ